MRPPVEIANGDMAPDASASSGYGCVAAEAFPRWLAEPQKYVPVRDHERYLTRNMLRLTSMLSHMKLQRGGLDDDGLTPVERLLARVDSSFRIPGLIVTVICISSARNMFFVYTALAIFLLLIAMKPGDAILDVMKAPLVALAFTVIIMLPAVFIGQPSSAVRIGLKVFLTVGLVICLSREVAYNELIAGLRSWHLPGLVIFVLDIALKYIVMLGEVAESVLTALTLRSVGHNTGKAASSGGVVGVTFLKSHDMSADMYEAMECRGFTGEYVVPKRRVFSSAAVVYMLLIVAEVCYLLFLDGVI